MLSPPLHLNSFHRCDDLHRNKNKKEGGGGHGIAPVYSSFTNMQSKGRRSISHSPFVFVLDALHFPVASAFVEY